MIILHEHLQLLKNVPTVVDLGGAEGPGPDMTNQMC